MQPLKRERRSRPGRDRRCSRMEREIRGMREAGTVRDREMQEIRGVQEAGGMREIQGVREMGEMQGIRGIQKIGAATPTIHSR